MNNLIHALKNHARPVASNVCSSISNTQTFNPADSIPKLTGALIWKLNKS